MKITDKERMTARENIIIEGNLCAAIIDRVFISMKATGSDQQAEKFIKKFRKHLEVFIKQNKHTVRLN